MSDISRTIEDLGREIAAKPFYDPDGVTDSTMNKVADAMYAIADAIRESSKPVEEKRSLGSTIAAHGYSWKTVRRYMLENEFPIEEAGAVSAAIEAMLAAGVPKP